MQLGTTLKTYIPTGKGNLAGNCPAGFKTNLSRIFPFIFPWTSLQRMTGVVFSGSEITLAGGRVDGDFFHVERVSHHSGESPLSGIQDQDLKEHGPVCVSLLRNRALVRHFRVPAQTDAEIDAMLPHLLASELPQSLEQFSWVWVPLPAQNLEAGFSQITVYMVRNDRIEESLAPLLDAGLNIVGLIPEGWSWAHIMGRVWDPHYPSDEFGTRSIIIKSARAHLLIVERSGQLLFDTILPLSACHEPKGESAEGETSTLDWDGPGFDAVREEFESLLGSPLPKPAIWPDALLANKDFDQEEFFFAASVAATGLGHERLLIPPKLQQRVRRRTVRRILTNLSRLGIFAALVWVILAVFEDLSMRQYLDKLEQQIVEEAPLVQGLQMEYNEIQENRKELKDNTEILQVLESLRFQVKAPIYLAHLNYVPGRGVTLRGGAPSSTHVLEMTDQLSKDPLWHWLRVMQLQTEKRDGVDQVNFVVEGQLNQGKQIGGSN